MKEFALQNGHVALVDDIDYPLVSARKWYAVQPSKGYATYATTRVNGKTVYMHRFVLGCSRNFHVDHIDGNGLNNTRVNLRLCDHSGNQANRGCRRSASGYKGVYQVGHRWEAKLKAQGKRVYIGLFETPEDAARAYDAAAVQHFGSFARVNFPVAGDRGAVHYLILSRNHTQGADLLIWWRPNGAGYTVRIDDAGKYTAEQIDRNPSYYNNGYDTVAVPLPEAQKLAVRVVSSEEIGKLLKSEPEAVTAK